MRNGWLLVTEEQLSAAFGVALRRTRDVSDERVRADAVIREVREWDRLLPGHGNGRDEEAA